MGGHKKYNGTFCQNTNAVSHKQSVKAKIKNSFIPITVTTKRPDDSAVSSPPSLQPQTAVTRKMTYI